MPHNHTESLKRFSAVINRSSVNSWNWCRYQFVVNCLNKLKFTAFGWRRSNMSDIFRESYPTFCKVPFGRIVTTSSPSWKLFKATGDAKCKCDPPAIAYNRKLYPIKTKKSGVPPALPKRWSAWFTDQHKWLTVWLPFQRAQHSPSSFHHLMFGGRADWKR